jgi:hypothetical protein
MDPPHGLRRATTVSAAVLGAGFALLLAYSVAEVLANPGISLADGYWRGELPWMGIIEGLVVAGATACAIVGTATVAALGGWLRRAITLLPLAAVGLWWSFAWARAGINGACCEQPAFDPWAYAYSAPLLALQLLIVPAIAIVALALLGRAEPERAGYISPSNGS